MSKSVHKFMLVAPMMSNSSLSRAACPRCGQDATVQFAAEEHFCYLCGMRWQYSTGLSDGPAGLAEDVFTAAELERLRIYRAAVQAGFYHD